MSTAEQLCEQSGIAWREATDSQLLADRLASDIAQELQHRIDESAAASLVVSGGSTPAPVFERLARLDIAWGKVAVTLADERWVAADDNESNERLVRERLLVGRAAEATFVPLYLDDYKPEEALGPVSQALADMTQPFTVVILGMGADGHTASLFPDAPEAQLRAAMDIERTESVAVMQPASVPQTRISLSRAALLDAEKRFLHITGVAKQQVLRDALQESCVVNDSGQQVPGSYTHGMKPIVGLLTEHPELACVYWSP